jgi:hypothetical protein
LPVGWRGIPIQHGTKAAIRRIVDEVMRRYPKNMPRDKMTPYRIELERQLIDLARRARSQGGVDLYLPIEYVHGVTITASFVVSQVSLPVPDEESAEQVAVDSAQLVACLTSEEGSASAVSVAGVDAARTESVAPPDPAEQLPFGSRRVDYVIPLPGHPTQWMLAGFSTIGDGDPEGKFAKLLVDLFDAIMTTFRWAREQNDDLCDQPPRLDQRGLCALGVDPVPAGFPRGLRPDLLGVGFRQGMVVAFRPGAR